MSESPFQALRAVPIASLRITVEEFVHRGTGARHLHLAADDPHNAFLVAFLTVPQDSTGVAHILEHTTLCGSRRFPIRDPFFWMTRRSLATFMNAFTSSDWTAYPFASQNPTDFDNLLQVYLDAVFFPLLDPLDFAQEGHRLEFADPADPGSPLVFKGVVYNEMKGAMSAPMARLWDRLQSTLFPTTTYHHNSGGEPSRIPDLSYEALKSFHARHYHPSNALFMTYGDIPAAAHQARFESLALARFDARPLNLAVPDEQRYAAPVRVETGYAAEPEPGAADARTHVVLGWLLGHSADAVENLRAHLLTGVLLDNSASPLRHALETTSLGSAPSELCGMDDSAREAVFVCGLEGARAEDAERIEDFILGEIRRVVEEGVPADRVESVLHQLELSQREIRGGHFPYGLRLMVNALSPALHGGDPVAVLDLDPALAALREAARDPGFVPGLARQWLLDNPHRVRVVMAPDPALDEREAAVEHRRLEAVRAALDDRAASRLVAQAEALAARQRAEEDPEILPRVGLADVPPELALPVGEAVAVGGNDAVWYGQGTNGLVYTHVVVDLPELSPVELDLLPWLTEVWTDLGCGGLSYVEAQAWQASVTGDLSADLSVRTGVTDREQARGLLILAGKALTRNHRPLAEIQREFWTRPRFDELERLRELVSQIRAHRDLSVTDRGHVLAMSAAGAAASPVGALGHRWDGLLGLQRLRALDDALEDEAALAEFAAELEALHRRVGAGRRRLLVVSEPAARSEVLESMAAAWPEVLPDGASAFVLPAPERVVREAWGVSTQVNFCARAYPAVPAEHPDAAALVVLGHYLGNGFLHRAVREQGGAYGAGAGYDSDSATFRFYSYRDPRLEATLADFDASLPWLAGGAHRAREVEEAILGVIGTIDRPESPAGEAVKAFYGELHGRSGEQRRRFRQRVLAVDLDHLREVGARYLRPELAHTAVLANPRILEVEAPRLGLTVRML